MCVCVPAGNVSSSTTWYTLAAIESLRGLRKGDTVLQIGVGSGVKCGVNVWKVGRPKTESPKAESPLSLQQAASACAVRAAARALRGRNALGSAARACGSRATWPKRVWQQCDLAETRAAAHACTCPCAWCVRRVCQALRNIEDVHEAWAGRAAAGDRQRLPDASLGRLHAASRLLSLAMLAALVAVLLRLLPQLGMAAAAAVGGR
jgi:hypothetical protein